MHSRTIRAPKTSHRHPAVRVSAYRSPQTGTLAEVGLGRWRPDDVTAALEARSRPACGPVAPACGLILAQVDYVTDYEDT